MVLYRSVEYHKLSFCEYSVNRMIRFSSIIVGEREQVGPNMQSLGHPLQQNFPGIFKDLALRMQLVALAVVAMHSARNTVGRMVHSH